MPAGSRGATVKSAGHAACPKTNMSYGLGQRAHALNLRGKQWALWNADPMPGYERGDDPIYTSIPFYVGVRDGLALGIFWDNPARGSVDLGAAKSDEMTLLSRRRRTALLPVRRAERASCPEVCTPI